MIMLNIYGVNLLLLAAGISSYSAIIFFKILFIILLNTLSTLVFVHAIIRRYFATGVKIEALSRKEAVEIEEKKRENEIKNEKNDIIKIQEEKMKEKNAEKERETEEKLKQGKLELKEKIKKARIKAKISKDKQFIEDTEKIIQDLLVKYNLTEEMLEE